MFAKSSAIHLFCLALLLPCFTHAALPGNAEVEAILTKHLIATRQAKGVAVALVDASGIRVVTVGEAASGVPLTADNLFEIGSVTKPFTGLLLAIAVERGEARLEDGVEKFLPDGLTLRDKTGEPIRLVDLATHRSGLPRLASNMVWKGKPNPYADYTESDLKDFVRTFRVTRTRNVNFAYSNTGSGLLGYALVRAGKQESFESLLQERILQPLGMTSTTADFTRFAERLAQPHDASGRPTPAWDLPLAHAGAGAIRATPGDMGRFIEAVAGLRDTKLGPAIELATIAREDTSSHIPIGLGWMWVPSYERTFVGHEGGTGGSSSMLLVDRAAKEGIFMAANSSVHLFDVARHLMDRRHYLPARP